MSNENQNLQQPNTPPSTFRRWWEVSSDGERLGAGCGVIALAIPAVTFMWLIAQAIADGACRTECVTRGWYGIFAVLAAVPVAVVGLVIFGISNAARKRQARGR